VARCKRKLWLHVRGKTIPAPRLLHLVCDRNRLSFFFFYFSRGQHSILH
jgi:hypothetical protein